MPGNPTFLKCIFFLFPFTSLFGHYLQQTFATNLFYVFGACFMPFLSDRFHCSRGILAINTFLYLGGILAVSNLTKVNALFATSLINIFASGLYPILYGMVLTTLEAHPSFSKDDFGSFIVWNYVGDALVDLFYYFNLSSDQQCINISVCACIFILVILGFNAKFKSKTKNDKASLPLESVANDTPSLPVSSRYFNQRFMFLAIVLSFYGMACCLLQLFSWPYNKFKIIYSILLLACEYVPYILLLATGRYWYKRWSAYWMLIVTGLNFVLSNLLKVYSPNHFTFIVYFSKMLDGASFSFFILSASRLAHDLAPARYKIFAQGIKQSCNLFGSVVSRHFYESTKPPGSFFHQVDMTTFNVAACISLVGLVLLVIKWAYFDRVMRIPCISSRKGASEEQYEGSYLK